MVSKESPYNSVKIPYINLHNKTLDISSVIQTSRSSFVISSLVLTVIDLGYRLECERNKVKRLLRMKKNKEESFEDEVRRIENNMIKKNARRLRCIGALKQKDSLHVVYNTLLEVEVLRE